MVKKFHGVAALMAGSLFTLTLSGSTAAAPHPATHQSRVTITFWNEMTGPYEVALNRVMAAFGKHYPNVHIVDVVVPNDATLEPKLLASIVGGNPPTISQLNPSWAAEFVKTGSLVDLTPFIRSKAGFSLKPFYQNLLAAGQFNGQQYALPFNVSAAVMYYNVTQFKRAGIKSPPTTWAQFEADARKLSTGGRHAFAITLVHPYPFRAFVVQAGGSFVLPNGKPNPAIFTPTGAATRAVALWANMVKNGSAVLTQGYGSQTDFANGTSSILEGTSAFYPYLAQAVGKRFPIGVAPLPGDVVNGSASFGGYLGIFSKATPAQKTAAEEFVKFLTSRVGQTIWMQDSEGYLPVRSDVLSVPSAKKFLATHPAQRVALSVFARSPMSPKVAWWPDFSTDLINDVTAVLDKKMTPAQAMHTAYQEALTVYANSPGR
ncbi:MAG: ABC transporter substrate-binding protein [Firmicutes bacterium]|nr:ABC transporter substrate-binding protein [Bacillota bacterium]